MEINTSNIYAVYVDLTYLINEYEQNCINVYKTLFETSTFWNDGRTELFLNNLKKEKLDAQITCNELYKIRDIYKYAYDNYSKIGNKIKFDEKKISKLVLNFEETEEQIKLILQHYSQINLKTNGYEINLIQNHIEELNDCLQKISDIKSTVETQRDDILKIENQIKEKIGKIKIELIKESDTSELQ